MNSAKLAGALIALASPGIGEPVDMTGLRCKQLNNYGRPTWEFYGDVAIRYYDDGGVSRMPRIGEGAYERFRDGEWVSVYYFFDVGDGLQMRVTARPGLIVLDENPDAPTESGVFPFIGECRPLWEAE